MTVALLDVNVLVALFDQGHIHHDPAHKWFARQRLDGWATCPLTENAVLRILSNPAYSGVNESTEAVRIRLSAFCASGEHNFWADNLTIREAPFDLTECATRGPDRRLSAGAGRGTRWQTCNVRQEDPPQRG